MGEKVRRRGSKWDASRDERERERERERELREREREREGETEESDVPRLHVDAKKGCGERGFREESECEGRGVRASVSDSPIDTHTQRKRRRARYTDTQLQNLFV
jgi:hypothetical protein